MKIQHIPLSIRNLHAKFRESMNTDAPCCNNDMTKFVNVRDLDTLIFPVLIPSTGPNKYIPNTPWSKRGGKNNMVLKNPCFPKVIISVVRLSKSVGRIKINSHMRTPAVTGSVQ